MQGYCAKEAEQTVNETIRHSNKSSAIASKPADQRTSWASFSGSQCATPSAQNASLGNAVYQAMAKNRRSEHEPAGKWWNFAGANKSKALNAENKTGMPQPLKDEVENRSGLSMDNVKVHYNSPDPEKNGAVAFTQGANIHIAPGQEACLPHEAWHVVQQAQGRVSPTVKMGDKAVNDNPALEKEADNMGGGSFSARSSETASLGPVPAHTGNVTQFARDATSRPMLANGRDLLQDTENILNEKKRDNTEDVSRKPGKPVDPDKRKFIDTTYENIKDNLLLDTNMLFEEHLQETIEQKDYFSGELKEIVGAINQNIEMESVNKKLVHKGIERSSGSQNEENPMAAKTGQSRVKQSRIDKTLHLLRRILPSAKSQLSVKNLRDHGWDLLKDDRIKGAVNNNPKAIGHIKLLKMLGTQYPYFGGSTEYHKGESKSFEFWIYHMSTLTRDGSRQHLPSDSADDGNAGPHLLKKPMMDYRTHGRESATEKGAWRHMVPYQNQRNLGTGITESKWEELPKAIQAMITKAAQNVEVQEGLHKSEYSPKIHGVIKSLTENSDIAEPWNALTEDEKKHLYGDILRTPWSKAHFQGTQNTDIENVAGVFGNFLETPEAATERYREELQRNTALMGKDINKSSQSQVVLPGSVYPDAKENDYEADGDGETIDLNDTLKQKHEKWYQRSMHHHKPIIGGISGHTLGYLNLYEAALDAKEKKDASSHKYPSMETLRACMLGALIGHKRHHSYDEVMTASDGMPTHSNITHTTENPLRFIHRRSYRDVQKSKNRSIHRAAEEATDATIKDIETPTEDTVMKKVMDKVVRGDERKKGLLVEALKRYTKNEGDTRQKDKQEINEILLHRERRGQENRRDL